MTNATDGVLSQAKHALYTQLRDRWAARSGADGREEATASGKDGGARRREGATLITLSEEAQQYLSAKMEAAGLGALSSSAEEAARENFDNHVSFGETRGRLGETRGRLGETRARLHLLNMEIQSRRHAQDNLEKNQAEYEKLLSTEATPAVELTGAAKEEALKIARAHGKSKMSGYNVIFADEATNKTYILKDDGSVWANETGVPRTEEQRRSMLSRLKDAIELGKAPLDGLIAARDALQSEEESLQAEVDALQADIESHKANPESRKANAGERLADLEARYGSFEDMMAMSGQPSSADQPASGSAEDESTGGGSNPTEDNEASAS